MIDSALPFWIETLTPSLLIIALAAAILPWVNRDYAVVRVSALGVCVIFGWRYMAWRLWDTIPPVHHPVDFALGVVFVTIEFLALFGTTLTNFFLCRIRDRSADADRNQVWLKGLNPSPRIAVLICTYNEEREVIEPTILGALAINYRSFHVWVCDDGKRKWLQDLCRKLDVGYLTRESNRHAKAGNINAALHALAELKQPPEFVAILDADFVPMSDFLLRTVAMMREKDVAVVQTPQHFSNPDPIQGNLGIANVWPDEQRFFFDTVMACKDAWGVAFCCGTSSLIRFSALQRIGGIPTDSVTEDYLLTLRLRERGLRTIYLNEVLSLGLAPEGLKEYYGQRSRWCLGAVQIFCGRSSPLNLGNKLPFIDRISVSDTILFWVATHAMRLLAFAIPPAYLLFGVQAVVATPADAVSYVIPFLVAQVIVLYWLTGGRILPIMSDLYATLCATEVLKAVISGLIKPKGQKFKVTAKGGDRSKRTIQWPVLNVFLFYLVLNIGGIVKAFWLDASSDVSATTMMAWSWSCYNIVILLLACFVCIEQPQRRFRHRFLLDSTVFLMAGGQSYECRTRDVSISGIGLIGKRMFPIGSTVRVQIGGCELCSRIVRDTRGGFALAFEPSLANRARVIKFIFARRYAMAGRVIRPRKVATAVGARLFR